jgi:uncharacterized membrane protein (UPF0127 family)
MITVAAAMSWLVVAAMDDATAVGMPDHLPASGLVIATASGDRHAFHVRIASDLEDRRRGLMFVDDLAEDEGMLFDNGVSQRTSMWMKNTPLSLDMLFIRMDGTISSIIPETVPFSRRTIFSREPVLAVLEIRGGTSERLGIVAGDRVVHPLFEEPEE